MTKTILTLKSSFFRLVFNVWLGHTCCFVSLFRGLVMPQKRTFLTPKVVFLSTQSLSIYKSRGMDGHYNEL